MLPASLRSLVGVGLRAALHRRASLLADREYWARHSGRIQIEQLRRLLAAAADTEFGREHDFARLASIPHDPDLLRAYRANVPVAEHNAFRPLLARMRERAEPSVTWPGVVRDWAQTSGTTAGDKFIPVSREMLRHNFRSSLDIFAHAINARVPLPHLYRGRFLFMGGSTDLTTNEHGVRTGDLSGIVTPLIRWPLSEIYLPGRDVALMSDWTAKIDAMVRVCLNEDLRGLSGMASWALVFFNRAIELAREQGRDVNCLRDLWPDFSFFIHGGVKYAPFDPRVRQTFSGMTSGPGSDIPHRIEVYPASEGFVAIQDVAGEPSLRLNIDHDVFFEFVPLDDYHEGDPDAFTCDTVTPGVRYVVVLTTCAGLWRYTLGDVVEFDEAPPLAPARLRIVGRHRHFINAFGENLIVENIEHAAAHAAMTTGLPIGEFTAAPVYPDAASGVRAGLELAVEIDHPSPTPSLIDAFRDAFDQSLKQQCVDYGIKRKDDLGMAPPTITPLPMGAFHRWMASRGKLGGQHKCPRCANHRDIIAPVVALALDSPAASAH